MTIPCGRRSPVRLDASRGLVQAGCGNHSLRVIQREGKRGGIQPGPSNRPEVDLWGPQNYSVCTRDSCYKQIRSTCEKSSHIPLSTKEPEPWQFSSAISVAIPSTWRSHPISVQRARKNVNLLMSRVTSLTVEEPDRQISTLKSIRRATSRTRNSLGHALFNSRASCWIEAATPQTC